MMTAISGKVERQNKVYRYTAKIEEGGDKPTTVTDVNIVDDKGQHLPTAANFVELKKLAFENADMLSWCKREGWKVENRSDNRSALISYHTGLIQRITLIDMRKVPQTMHDGIALELFNFVDQPLGERKIYKGGIDEFVNSPEFTPCPPVEYPEPVLQEGVIYSGDNGERVCVKCAGQAARYTGYDRSGMRVLPISRSENKLWRLLFGEDLRCERGCTSYGDKDEDNMSKVSDKLRHSRQRNSETR